MTQDEIIEMARQAELVKTIDCCGVPNKFCSQDQWKGNLSVFAKLVAAKERERITALNAPAIEECNTYIANLERELQFTQKSLADVELLICQRSFMSQEGQA
jgi:hypothetical protein